MHQSNKAMNKAFDFMDCLSRRQKDRFNHVLFEVDACTLNVVDMLLEFPLDKFNYVSKSKELYGKLREFQQEYGVNCVVYVVDFKEKRLKKVV
jgi:hypothetical protein